MGEKQPVRRAEEYPQVSTIGNGMSGGTWKRGRPASSTWSRTRRGGSRADSQSPVTLRDRRRSREVTVVSRICHRTSHVTAPKTPQSWARRAGWSIRRRRLLSSMTSYLSSLLWGTSQLDDAIGMLHWLSPPSAIAHSFPPARQGDVRAAAKRFGGYRAQPRDLRPDTLQVRPTQGCHARIEA